MAVLEFFEKHRDECEGKSQEEIQGLLNQFMQEYNYQIFNQAPLTENTAKTADDWYDLACEAKSRCKAIKYCENALELEPDYLDAELMIADIAARSDFEHLERLEKVCKHGEELMKKEGLLPDSIGAFWGILETRPYMRALCSKLQALIEMGMMKKAIDVAEEMLTLCESDNMGIRFQLVSLYAYFEDAMNANRILEKYPGHATSMLMPLSLLYFKLGDLELSKKYLNTLMEINKDFKEFLKYTNSYTVQSFYDDAIRQGYRPNSMGEIIMCLMDSTFLFERADAYFEWANQICNPKKTKKKKSTTKK